MAPEMKWLEPPAGAPGRFVPSDKPGALGAYVWPRCQTRWFVTLGSGLRYLQCQLPHGHAGDHEHYPELEAVLRGKGEVPASAG